MDEKNVSEQYAYACISRHTQKYLAEKATMLIINIIFNVVFSITATLGNLLVLVAVWRSSHSRSASTTLLCGLAVSDLCVGLICEPIFIGFQILIVKNDFTSCLLTTLSVITTVFLTDVTLLTITAISIDRYLAIYLHLRYEEVVTETKAKIVIACLWVISPLHLLALIRGFEAISLVAAVMISVCLVTVSFIWIKIYKVVRHHQAQIQDQVDAQAPQQFNMARFRKSAINTFIILIVFLLCYIPYFITSINLAYEFSYANLTVSHFILSLVFLNSSVNPLLYCYRHSDIKAAAKQTLSQFFCQTQAH